MRILPEGFLEKLTQLNHAELLMLGSETFLAFLDLVEKDEPGQSDNKASLLLQELAINNELRKRH